MALLKFFKKGKEIVSHETVEDKTTKTEETFDGIAPKNIGRLDMVIAFDTTGSMAQYIGAVRNDVAELIPQLFKDNDDLRLGIVAFGDYCDMAGVGDFGDAYQCLPLTNNENALVKFVNESKDTSGGDGDEFYELVIKRIVEETPWREGSTRVILLIADANPHGLGYTYGDYVTGNQIDWRVEARKAASMGIKIDTVSICGAPWYKELSALTNGVSVPFRSSGKTSELIRACSGARGKLSTRLEWDKRMEDCDSDEELRAVYRSLKKERDTF